VCRRCGAICSAASPASAFEARKTPDVCAAIVPALRSTSSESCPSGTRLSPDGVHYLLVRHVKAAAEVCPLLKGKRVTVHVLRHTMALDLLQGGVDRSVIAMWLGHDSVETTQIYLEATLAMKEKALGKTKPLKGTFKRYRPGDQLLGFLNNL
jgi:integrase